MSNVAVGEATSVTVDEVTELVERAMASPANLRITLARRVLESLESVNPSTRTRDKSDFAGAVVPVLTPDELIARLDTTGQEVPAGP